MNQKTSIVAQKQIEDDLSPNTIHNSNKSMDLNQHAIEVAYQKDKYGSFKIGVFGIANIGKSTLITLFIFNTFRSEYIPTYEDNFKVSTQVDGFESELELLDTPGTEEAFYNLFIKDQLIPNT